MKKILILTIIALSIFTVGYANNFNKIELNKTVAIVNNQPITLYQLNQETNRLLATVSPNQRYGINENIIKKQALEELINKNLLLQIAERANINISTVELNNNIEKLAKKNNLTLSELKNSVESSGLPFSQYKENVKQQLIANKLQQQAISQQINILPSEINKYIRNHTQELKNNIEGKKEYKLQNIVINIPKTLKEKNSKLLELNKLVKNINEGKISFTQIAKKISKASNAENGGSLGTWMSFNQVPSIYQDKLINLKVKKATEPFIANNAIQILYLSNVKNTGPKLEIKEYYIYGIIIKLNPNITAKDAKKLLNQALKDIDNGEDFSKVAEKYNQEYQYQNGNFGWMVANENSNILTPKVFDILKSLKRNSLSKPFDLGNNSWMIIKYTDVKAKNIYNQIEKQKAIQAIFSEKAQQIYKSWIASMRDNAYIKILDNNLKQKTLY